MAKAVTKIQNLIRKNNDQQREIEKLEERIEKKDRKIERLEEELEIMEMAANNLAKEATRNERQLSKIGRVLGYTP